MLLINCPYCGEERPELEFRNAGEAHIARPTNITEVEDGDFEAFLYLRTNPKGIVYERWRHMHGCGRFFNAVRDTVTDRFFTTYKAGQPKPNPDRFVKAAAAVEPLTADASIPVVEAKKSQAAPARPVRKQGAAAAAEPSPVDAPPDERKPARGGKRFSPPSNSDAPAAEPKPRRTKAAVAPAEDEPAAAEKPKASRSRKAAAPSTDGSEGAAPQTPRRPRKPRNDEGEA